MPGASKVGDAARRAATTGQRPALPVRVDSEPPAARSPPRAVAARGASMQSPPVRRAPPRPGLEGRSVGQESQVRGFSFRPGETPASPSLPGLRRAVPAVTPLRSGNVSWSPAHWKVFLFVTDFEQFKPPRVEPPGGCGTRCPAGVTRGSVPGLLAASRTGGRRATGSENRGCRCLERAPRPATGALGSARPLLPLSPSPVAGSVMSRQPSRCNADLWFVPSRHRSGSFFSPPRLCVSGHNNTSTPVSLSCSVVVVCESSQEREPRTGRAQAPVTPRARRRPTAAWLGPAACHALGPRKAFLACRSF